MIQRMQQYFENRELVKFEDVKSEQNEILLLEKASPYVFRTKLERVLNHTIKYANCENDNQLLEACKSIVNKLKYISDQSNQTSDGCLNSFIVLKQDMLLVKAGLKG